MWEWLASPIDPSRVHEVGTAVSWHARSMVLAWGVLAPLAVMIARFFKVLPSQNWPAELDSTLWWRSHWMGQSAVLVLSITGLVLVLPSNWDEMRSTWFFGLRCVFRACRAGASGHFSWVERRADSALRQMEVCAVITMT